MKDSFAHLGQLDIEYLKSIKLSLEDPAYLESLKLSAQKQQNEKKDETKSLEDLMLENVSILIMVYLNELHREFAILAPGKTSAETLAKNLRANLPYLSHPDLIGTLEKIEVLDEIVSLIYGPGSMHSFGLATLDQELLNFSKDSKKCDRLIKKCEIQEERLSRFIEKKSKNLVIPHLDIQAGTPTSVAVKEVVQKIVEEKDSALTPVVSEDVIIAAKKYKKFSELKSKLEDKTIGQPSVRLENFQCDFYNKETQNTLSTERGFLKFVCKVFRKVDETTGKFFSQKFSFFSNYLRPKSEKAYHEMRKELSEKDPEVAMNTVRNFSAT